VDGPRPTVSLRPVDAGSWRDVARLTVAPGQERFVASPTYYLALCAYGDVWQPMSVNDARSGAVVGFLMWGIDDADASCWLGGVLLDAAHQGHGVGRAAIVEALRVLGPRSRSAGFALAYHPDNTVARSLYASLGFVETGEVDDDEVVARLLKGT
jgi:diamine N-acetyltransferase